MNDIQHGKVKITMKDYRNVKIEIDGKEIKNVLNVYINMGINKKPSVLFDIVPSKLDFEVDGIMHKKFILGELTAENLIKELTDRMLEKIK